MIFSIIVAIAFFLGALVCYISCCAASRVDHMSEEYWQKKIADQQLKNLKNRKK